MAKVSVPVNEHSAIVYENFVPHKLYSLENSIGVDIEIVTLSFFIIGQNDILETNQLRLSVFDILKTKTKLSKVLIDEILSYIYCNSNIKIAKERREEARKILNRKKKYWTEYEDDNTGFYHLYSSELF